MGHICGWMQRKHSTCVDTWIWILRKATNDTSNRVKIPNFQTMIALWVCTTCTKSFLINLIAPLRIACTRDPRGYVVGGGFLPWQISPCWGTRQRAIQKTAMSEKSREQFCYPALEPGLSWRRCRSLCSVCQVIGNGGDPGGLIPSYRDKWLGHKLSPLWWERTWASWLRGWEVLAR